MVHMATSELDIYSRKETELVDRVLKPIFDRMIHTNEVKNWAGNRLKDYSSLPQQNSKERRHARDLIAQTAAKLLGNPQDIAIAQKIWKGVELSRDGALE